jgi:hypothetical protein
MINRRQLLSSAAALTGAAALQRNFASAQQPGPQADYAAGKEKADRTKPAWMRDPHPEPGEARKQ